MRKHHWNFRNIVILILGVLIAFFFLQSDLIQEAIARFADFKYIGAFISGIFFASGFTVVPATAAILILAKSTNPVILALLGGLGALISDFIIFTIIKAEEKNSSDFRYLIKKSGLSQLKVWKAKHRWLLPLIAGIIYSSPLPDELADTLFEVAHYKQKRFLILTYIFHVIGILVIAVIGTSL